MDALAVVAIFVAGFTVGWLLTWWTFNKSFDRNPAVWLEIIEGYRQRRIRRYTQSADEFVRSEPR